MVLSTYLTSDHQLVNFTIRLDCELDIAPPRSIPLYSKTNWQRYRLLIHLDLNQMVRNAGSERLVHTTNEIDQLADMLTESILTAKRATVPMIKPKAYALQLTSPVKDKTRERNRLRRLVQRCPYLGSVHTQTINRLTAEIREEINEIRNEDFSNKIEAIPEIDRDGKIWKITKLLRKRRDFMPPLKDEDNNRHLTPQEKCNVLANQFSKNYDNPLKDDNRAHTRRVKNRVKRYFRHCTVDPT